MDFTSLDNIKAAIARQPLAVVVSANNKYIHSYASGVIDAADCYNFDNRGLNPVNHAVLMVGYGTDEITGLDYWLVKNSWDTTWGDKGYFKIKSEDTSDWGLGICGIQWANAYPILK